MTATAHALTGASIAYLVPNPTLALPLAFASNFLLDMVPHWDVGTGWHKRRRLLTFLYAGVDVVLGFSLGFLFFSSKVHLSYLFLLMFVATLADWAEAPYLFLGWNFPPFSWFYKFQSKIHHRDGTTLGVLTQIIVVGSLLLLSSR